MGLNKVGRSHLVLVAAIVLLADACRSVTGTERAIRVIEVAPQKVACGGAFPQECLYIRPSTQSHWEYFYDEISGFTFEPGYAYVLRVERTSVKNPPADGSAYRLTLLAIISKTPAS